MKQTIYKIIAVGIGLLLGSIAHWLVEAWWIGYALSHGVPLTLRHTLGSACYLPWYVEGGFLLGGLAFGLFLGSWGWRVVYVEKRRGK
ncbi:MAG TPA: hypothetical protein VN420_05750 [Candidatus Fimivivens sp.]|nr:hypothetical protein [Candidatus Fimivivens sp.]